MPPRPGNGLDRRLESSMNRLKLTYAGVISTLALFIALGGAGYAATQLPKNSVGSRQLRANAVTGAKIKNAAVTGEKLAPSALGTVPAARHADAVAVAETATSVTSAARAGTVIAARSVTPPEPVRRIGTPGQPAFGAGWKNADFIPTPVGFYKDRKGIVHLEGEAQASAGASQVIFTLPSGYAPPFAQNLVAPGGVTPDFSVALSTVGVGADGTVRLQKASTLFVTLDGLTWRAAD
jgi:hypothetical protein